MTRFHEHEVFEVPEGWTYRGRRYRTAVHAYRAVRRRVDRMAGVHAVHYNTTTAMGRLVAEAVLLAYEPKKENP